MLQNMDHINHVTIFLKPVEEIYTPPLFYRLI